MTEKLTAPAQESAVFYPNFDWLRLLLATQVVAIHCGISPTVFINPVPAFLAISGFVVLGSMERRPLPHFFISRALRVLPLLAVSFLAVWYFYDFKAMVKNILFWLWPRGDLPPNPVVWTLIYEEVLYALLAVLFMLGVYKTRWMPCVVFALIVGLAFFFPALRYSEWTVLGLSFLIGNIAYMFRDHIPRIFNKTIAILLLTIMIAVVYRLPYTSLIRYSVQYLDYISFAAMIVFAIAGPQLPRLKVDMSYSLYLVHCIVLGQINYFIPHGPRLFWFVLLASLPICFACWHLIEKPALSLKGRWLVEPSKDGQNVPRTATELG